MKFRRIVMAIMAMQMVVPANAARNLITNFDHRGRMGVDLPMGWTKHIRHKLVTTLEVLPQADGSVRFIATDEPAEIAAALGWKDANRVRNGK